MASFNYFSPTTNTKRTGQTFPIIIHPTPPAPQEHQRSVGHQLINFTTARRARPAATRPTTSAPSQEDRIISYLSVFFVHNWF